MPLSESLMIALVEKARPSQNYEIREEFAIVPEGLSMTDMYYLEHWKFYVKGISQSLFGPVEDRMWDIIYRISRNKKTGEYDNYSASRRGDAIINYGERF